MARKVFCVCDHCGVEFLYNDGDSRRVIVVPARYDVHRSEIAIINYFGSDESQAKVIISADICGDFCSVECYTAEMVLRLSRVVLGDKYVLL